MKVLQTQPGWHGPFGVAYSASGRQVLGLGIADDRREVDYCQVWDLATGNALLWRTLGTPNDDLGVWLLSEPNGPAFLRAHGYWPEGEELPIDGPPRPEHARVLGWRRGVDWLGFGPTGRTCLRQDLGRNVGEPPSVVLWTFRGRRRRSLDMAGVTEAVRGAAFSPDETIIALITAENEVRLYDAAKGLCSALIDCRERVGAIRYSPVAPLLAVAAGKTTWLCEGPRGQVRGKLPSFDPAGKALAFSPDGRLLAAGSDEGQVRVWEVASGRELSDLSLGHGTVNDLAFAPDLMTVAAACQDRAVVVWDVEV